LRKLRLSRGLSQEALADLARISTEAIGALERGNRKLPHRQTLTLLIDALELEAPDRAMLEAAAFKPSLPRQRSQMGEPFPAHADRTNLPKLLTHFVGRESELESLEQLIRERRLVTITGAGGVGKTRTSIQVSTAIADRFRDGAWLVDLAPLRDATLVPQAIAAALEIREISGHALVKTIASTLRAKNLLLIVDNCEHVIDEAAETIDFLLKECSEVSILATSRQPLGIQGEGVFRLPTFAFPDETATLDATAAVQFPAIELFVQSAKAAESSFALTDNNASAVASICRHIDGIAFAIELAAAKVAALSVSQIAAYLKYRFELLTGGTRNALPRQQTLRALIDWSFDLLPERERAFLSRLSIFPGGFSAEAAAAACTDETGTERDALGLLISLVEKSLVVSEPGSDGEKRFRLLETTREYARERLAASGQFEEIARRCADYILAFARRTRPAFGSTAQEGWLNVVAPEIENVRSVLEWALAEEHEIALGAEVAATFGPFWESRSYAEGKRWLTAARGVITRLEPHLAARVLLEYVRGLPLDEEAIELSELAINAYRSVHDIPGLCHALAYRAQILINAGRYEEASEIAKEGEALSPHQIDVVAMAHLSVIHGFADLYQHKLESAFALFDRADSLLKKEPHPREEALISRGFAEVALARGRIDEAVELYTRALDLLEGSDNIRMIGLARYQLAHGLLLANRINEALGYAVAAVKNLIGAQVPFAFLEAVMLCAAAYERSADYKQAARLLGFVNERIALLPFKFGVLMEDLRTTTSSALEARMGQAAFTDALRSGAPLDELGILAEIC
jgi:predicted ATPase